MTDRWPTYEAMVRTIDEIGAVLVPTSFGDTVGDLVEALKYYRRSADTVDEKLRRLILLQGQMKAALSEAKAAYDERWARAFQGALRSSGDLAPRERYANYDLKCVGELIALRRAEKAHNEVATTLEYAREAARTIAARRSDIMTLLRAINVETSLER